MSDRKGHSKTVEIRGQRFEYVSTRAYDPTEVYRGKRSYLRIGPAEVIAKEIASQRKLLAEGFPVAKITDEGVLGKRYFYIERSLGDSILRHAFARDYEKQGSVSPKNFSIYLGLTKRFAEAQLFTVSESRKSELRKAVNLADMMVEFKEMASKISKAFKKANERISIFPIVLCHGDLNVSNYLAKGIIDFEWSFWGNAGYDIIGNLFFTYFFPEKPKDGKTRVYAPTEKQAADYLDAMDRIYSRHGLPRPSGYADDFIYPKAVWAASKMGAYPETQKWRFDMLRQITEEYLAGEPIIETIESFPS